MKSQTKPSQHFHSSSFEGNRSHRRYTNWGFSCQVYRKNFLLIQSFAELGLQCEKAHETSRFAHELSKLVDSSVLTGRHDTCLSKSRFCPLKKRRYHLSNHLSVSRCIRVCAGHMLQGWWANQRWRRLMSAPEVTLPFFNCIITKITHRGFTIIYGCAHAFTLPDLVFQPLKTLSSLTRESLFELLGPIYPPFLLKRPLM